MKKIDWHAGFISAMKLELIENEKDLIYDEEHPVANRAHLTWMKRTKDMRIT